MRMWAVVLGMEVIAVVFGVIAFGWLVLLVGVPLLLVSVLVLLVVRVSEHARERQRKRAVDFGNTVYLDPQQRGLMSGFFEMPTQSGPVDERGTVNS